MNNGVSHVYISENHIVGTIQLLESQTEVPSLIPFIPSLLSKMENNWIDFNKIYPILVYFFPVQLLSLCSKLLSLLMYYKSLTYIYLPIHWNSQLEWSFKTVNQIIWPPCLKLDFQLHLE